MAAVLKTEEPKGSVGSNPTPSAICEACSALHNRVYGSGRFCGSTCARSFSTKKDRICINAKLSAASKRLGLRPPSQKGKTRSLGTRQKVSEALLRFFETKNNGPSRRGRYGFHGPTKEKRNCKNCEKPFFCDGFSDAKCCKPNCTQERRIAAYQAEVLGKVLQNLPIQKKHLRRYLLKTYGVCKTCGIKEWQGKLLSLQIHHKDFNRFNNSPDNLIMMNHKDHMKYHHDIQNIEYDQWSMIV